mmetsp:Transcript_38276/g.125201  ORF Transcript_38276/g.125201 Transcript_38276/m.125201 type:complete len:201 (-) Transcript_38276:875-1477(-)
MTCFTRVYSSKPYALKSLPPPLCLNPPCGISATSGMCVLTHTVPKSNARQQRSARAWSLVHTEDASPYCTPFAIATAAASSAKGCTVMTGPKISSCTISSSCRKPATTLGSKKKPLPPAGRPPATTRAWGGSRSKKPLTRSSCALLLRGPTSTPSESIVVAEPSLVFCSASRARRATIVSYAAASTTTRVAAVQSCPALK